MSGARWKPMNQAPKNAYIDLVLGWYSFDSETVDTRIEHCCFWVWGDLPLRYGHPDDNEHFRSDGTVEGYLWSDAGGWFSREDQMPVEKLLAHTVCRALYWRPSLIAPRGAKALMKRLAANYTPPAFRPSLTMEEFQAAVKQTHKRMGLRSARD